MPSIPVCMLALHAWLSSFAHPYFVSVTEIEYDSKAGSVGVSCKFFTDDLEEALKGGRQTKVDLSKGDRAQNLKKVEAYLQAHFRVSMGASPLSLRFLGMEQEADATWCFLEATGLPAGKSLDLFSDCFYEIRKEQVHIFHVKVDGERRSRRIVNPEKSFRLTF